MPEDDDLSPEEQFRQMLQRLLAGQLDPEQVAQLSAMGVDPSQLAQAMQQMQSAFATGDGGIDWEQAKRQALHIANQSDLGVAAGARADLDSAFALATLWLSEATTIPEPSEKPRAITRGAWVEATLPVWQSLAEPVAASVADALTATLAEEAPDDMQSMIANAGRMLRGVGGSLFAAQLGQVVGRLSTEVVSGGDVGIPLMPAGQAVILPQNFADFGAGLEIPEDQLALSVATRELAHARLFRHARWLQLDVTTQVAEYARGIHVDTSALEDIAERFDPSHPEELTRLLSSGELLPEPTPQQTAALARLETVLALIEGWVDVVTADATSRLPEAGRVAEVVRRRRAVGGPAEKALASLVGLELRPRRLREAAAMWRAVTDAVGIPARDALWDYPDLMPTAEDIDDPAGLISRLLSRASGEAPAPDAMDEALAQLLAEETTDPDDGPDAEGPTPV